MRPSITKIRIQTYITRKTPNVSLLEMKIEYIYRTSDFVMLRSRQRQEFFEPCRSQLISVEAESVQIPYLD